MEAASKKSDFERTELSKHKSGVFTGGYRRALRAAGHDVRGQDFGLQAHTSAAPTAQLASMKLGRRRSAGFYAVSPSCAERIPSGWRI